MALLGFAGHNTAGDDWIAIEPPGETLEITIEGEANVERDENASSTRPPSFRDSQYATILRRQRRRPPDNSGLKNYPTFPSRFIHLTDSFEFAGWGSVTRIRLTDEALKVGKERIEMTKDSQILGQFTASAVAGNAILGGVFYTIPVVVAAAGIFNGSPISLIVATLVLFLWRPVMEELASALPINGAPYTYLLNVSTKAFALFGAALLLLDFAATSVVSAATSAVYISAEVPSLPFPTWVVSITLLVIFTIISLMGVRESTRIALTVLVIHLITMFMLIVASCIHWGRSGVGQLTANWELGRTQNSIAKQLFYGICLGMLGMTGFECTSSYVSLIKPGTFPLVLRNLQISASLLNPILMLLVLAIVPLNVTLGGANVLSVLANISGGRWLRIWVVIDAVVVLCGGVLTGILSSCELLGQLALHRIIPSIFLVRLPRTRSPYVSILSFGTFAVALYASASSNLVVISEMFSLVWLLVMALFPVSLLLLKFNRGRLKRDGKPTKLVVILAAVSLVSLIFAGNVAYQPRTAGYFSAYFLGILVFFYATQNKIHLLRCIYWIYDQHPILHRWNVTAAWDRKLIGFMKRLKRRPVCILVKTDEINSLFHMILYVRKNEETSCLKIIHFYEEEKGIPSELEANAKILDEAFPEITVDLILVQASFTPANIAALSHQLDIPQSLMFMSCPGEQFKYSVALLGTRIISL